tara:strand:+ start:874 stop:1095 length:222 start_codon:yes stop_codon:yes gene_type:complete
MSTAESTNTQEQIQQMIQQNLQWIQDNPVPTESDSHVFEQITKKIHSRILRDLQSLQQPIYKKNTTMGYWIHR